MHKADPVEALIRQNCASIVARHAALNLAVPGGRREMVSPLNGGFGCRICGKKFATFQALGGHVSSHAKHTLSGEDNNTAVAYGRVSGFPARSSKVHECATCKIRFSSGQALGGHMRRHYPLGAKRKRDAIAIAIADHPADINKIAFSFKIDVKEEPQEVNPVQKRAFPIDLNFPPPLESSSETE